MKLIRVLTPGTSTGTPSTTRGLYLNFNTARVAARSNRLLVENSTTGSRTVPAAGTLTSSPLLLQTAGVTADPPEQPRTAALLGWAVDVVVGSMAGVFVGFLVNADDTDVLQDRDRPEIILAALCQNDVYPIVNFTCRF